VTLRKTAVRERDAIPTLELYFQNQVSRAGVSRYFSGGSSHPPQPTAGFRFMSLSTRSLASFSVRPSPSASLRNATATDQVGLPDRGIAEPSASRGGSLEVKYRPKRANANSIPVVTDGLAERASIGFEKKSADSNEGGQLFQSDRGHHSNLMAASLVSSRGPVLVMSW
jgi:hypothetical protein